MNKYAHFVLVPPMTIKQNRSRFYFIGVLLNASKKEARLLKQMTEDWVVIFSIIPT